MITFAFGADARHFVLLLALLGVIAMVVTGVMTPAEAYDEMDWMVIILLGSILSLGFAMQETGAASFLANHLVDFTRAWGPRGTLAALYLLTSLLTELISNNGAAVVLTPIAAATAEALGVSPLPFIVAVMFAASNSFMTPWATRPTPSSRVPAGTGSAIICVWAHR